MLETSDTQPLYPGGVMTTREMVSINKAAELVRVSRRTIYNWIQQGKVEFIRTAGGNIRIYADSLWKPGGSRV